MEIYDLYDKLEKYMTLYDIFQKYMIYMIYMTAGTPARANFIKTIHPIHCRFFYNFSPKFDILTHVSMLYYS